MKRSWILVAAIALGVGLTVRLSLDSSTTEQPVEVNSLLETGSQKVDLYNTDDSRTRIVYFGYTHCPDVCPTSLAVLSSALKELPEDKLNKVWPIFISLDPERDTADKAQQYAQYFHKNFTGFSGTEQQIKELASSYGVLYTKTELKDSALEYAVDHSSYFYFLKPDGSLIEKVAHTLNPAMLIDAIDRLPQS
ncbi:SCO family protein [Vibrio sp. Of7-15]|uniref:SCO family protein n=1 Tax=Vibrio sp. Of7-15 TaxID=2724879 RepID=UPI001EF16AC9|nr:SCO family protein [Vibrio sp. Of7-15]MCG7498342.1 SCO family protein [Vibrio sp. Of7-15]